MKVLDVGSSTTTTLSKFGILEDIKDELDREGDWVFISAIPQDE